MILTIFDDNTYIIWDDYLKNGTDFNPSYFEYGAIEDFYVGF